MIPQPRHRRPGNQSMPCPACRDDHPAHRNRDCLSVLIDERGMTWNCKRCGWVGSDMGGQPMEPSQAPGKKFTPQAFDPLTDAQVKYLADRGISQATAQAWSLGAREKYVGDGTRMTIAFPLMDTSGAQVGVKYRSGDKRFVKDPGSARVFYGLWKLDPDDKTLVIVEGEMDALSCYEAGIKNVLSVPDGSPPIKPDGQIDPAHDKAFEYVWNSKVLLDQAQRVVIATDMDRPGRALCEELARRIGRERCYVAELPEKDANETLVKHGPQALREAIQNARPYPIKSLQQVSSFEEKVLDLYHSGRSKGVSTGWESVDRILTVRPGEFWVVTGVPGSGKSEWIDALMVNLAQMQDWRFAIASFENPPDEHLAKLAEKVVLKPFADGPTPRMSSMELRRALGWLHNHFYFIRADDEQPTIDFVLEAARAAVMRFGIRGLVVDPYNHLAHPEGSAAQMETTLVSGVISKLLRFAQLHGVWVVIVAHPKKLQRDRDGEIPEISLYDISGSAHWYNMADVGIVVSRVKSEDGQNMVEVAVRKVRFKAVGEPGSAFLLYDRTTGCYRER